MRLETFLEIRNTGPVDECVGLLRAMIGKKYIVKVVVGDKILTTDGFQAENAASDDLE